MKNFNISLAPALYPPALEESGALSSVFLKYFQKYCYPCSRNGDPATKFDCEKMLGSVAQTIGRDINFCYCP
ncbi:MAG: hypothetical protein LBB05_00405 [Puniceicoccales bacterium]|nr:hypothetical protein [Puniceicoccales bacterium]